MYVDLHSVHGFERTVVSVDEGSQPVILVVRMDIKGNTMDEDPQFRVTDIDLTLRCQDDTTGNISDEITRANLYNVWRATVEYGLYYTPVFHSS